MVGQLLGKSTRPKGEHVPPTHSPVADKGSIAPPVIIADEGATSHSGGAFIPAVTQDSEGDAALIPVVTQDSEGYESPNGIFMPDVVNLEIAGLRCSEQVSAQETKKYNLFSALSKVCAFGLVLAETVFFACTSICE